MEDKIDFEKKRSLISYLLDNSINVYKKYKNSIGKFSDEEIENFFKGNVNYNYPIKESKEIYFKKLLIKFNNLGFLLENWYPDLYKRCYIIDLWKKNQCLESLKELNEEEIKKKLPYINNWPKDIQDEFYEIIREYIEGTKAYQMKAYLEKNEEKDVDEIVGLMRDTKNSVKNMDIPPEYGKDKLNNNYDVMLYAILGVLATPTVYILTKGYNESKEININESIRQKDLKQKYNAPNEKSNIDLKDITKKCKNFLNNRYVAIAHTIISFANLGYSCYQLYHTLKQVKVIAEYKERLNRIKESFISHCEIGMIYGDDIVSIKKKIQDAKIKISEDYENLLKLIVEIKASIDYLKSQKKKSKISLGISITSGIIGIAGAVASGGLTLAMYCASSGANLASGIINIVDIVKAGEKIEELKKLLVEANEEKKKVEKMLDELEKKAKSLESFIKAEKFNY